MSPLISERAPLPLDDNTSHTEKRIKRIKRGFIDRGVQKSELNVLLKCPVFIAIMDRRVYKKLQHGFCHLIKALVIKTKKYFV